MLARKENLKPCRSIMMGTMICSSALRTVVVMHANGEENMRLGCVCAKCGGGTYYITCAIRDAVAVTILKVILSPSLPTSDF